jgi:DNA-directed RNA polymerase subunit H
MTATKKHILVPKHSLVSEKEKQKVFDTYNVSTSGLPRILLEDAAIVDLKAKAGDLIKIERESRTMGTSIYYRVVVEK